MSILKNAAKCQKYFAVTRHIAGALAIGTILTTSAVFVPAQAKEPIKIGALAPGSSIGGKAIFRAAELATKEINANGGIDGRDVQLIKYDDHGSASNAVRAFQRAVNQDHVTAMVGTFLSEIALAVEPWSARLKTPFIVTGSSSPKISHKIHEDYSHYKYVFLDWLTSYQMGRSVCDFAKDILVDQLHYKTAAIMVENAAWTKPLDATYQKCLPKAGLKVVARQVFSPNTSDFSPVYNKIEASNADVMFTAIAHVGVKPTVQWHRQQVPVLMAGVNAQAGSSDFWDATNGATQGVVTETADGPGGKITSKSVPFQKAFRKEFDSEPPYDAYSTYDSIYILKHAIERAHSTDADKLVSSIEKTHYLGTWGTVKFQDKKSKNTHGLVYHNGGVTNVMLQWQDGKQVPIWPKKAATGKIKVPDSVKAK